MLLEKNSVESENEFISRKGGTPRGFRVRYLVFLYMLWGKLYPRNKCNGHHHFNATIIGHRLQTSYSRVDTFKRTVFPSGIRLSGTNHQLLVHVPGAQSFDLFY